MQTETTTRDSTRGQLEAAFLRYRRTNDPRHLEGLFARVRPELLRIARYYLRDADAAEDVVHAALVTALEKRDSFESDRRLVPWLTGILLHKISTHRRSLRRRLGNVNADRLLAASPEREAELKEVQRLVRDAVQRLPARYREVLDLYLLQSQPGGAIAAQLDRPVGTIRAQIHRGLHQLRRMLPTGLALGSLLTLGRKGRAARPATGAAASATAWWPVLLAAGGLLAVVGVLWSVAAGRSASAAPRSGSTAPLHLAAARDALPADTAPPRRSDVPAPVIGSTTSAALEAGAALGLRLVAVERSSREPVPRAELELHVLYQDGSRFDRVVRVDARGAFVLPGSPSLIEHVLLEARGDTPGAAGGQSSMRALFHCQDTAFSSLERLEVPLVPEVSIGGQVVDEQGLPVEGALVQLHGFELTAGPSYRQAPTCRQATTDAAGRWSIPDAPDYQDRLRVAVSHPEFEPELVTAVDRAPPVEHLLAGTAISVLRRGRSVELVIQDGAGNHVQPSEVVIYERVDPPLYTVPVPYRAGERNHLHLPADDVFALRVRVPGYATQMRTLRPAAIGDVLELRVRPVHRWDLTVLDHAGAPVPWARVRTIGHTWAEAQRTDELGRLVLEGENRRRTILEIRRPGVLGSTVRAIDGGDHVVRLPPVHALRVRVSDAATGGPVTDARLLLRRPGEWPMGERIAAGGDAYELRYLPPRVESPVVELEVSRPGYATWVGEPIRPGHEPEHLEVELEPVESLHLRVLGTDGEPVDSATLIVCSKEDPALLRMGTLEGVASPTEILYTDGHRWTSIRKRPEPFYLAVQGRDGFRLVDAAQLDGRAELRLTPMGCLEGSAGPHAEIELVPELAGAVGADAPLRFAYRRRADADGRYHFCHVPAGPARVFPVGRPELARRDVVGGEGLAARADL